MKQSPRDMSVFEDELTEMMNRGMSIDSTITTLESKFLQKVHFTDNDITDGASSCTKLAEHIKAVTRKIRAL